MIKSKGACVFFSTIGNGQTMKVLVIFHDF
jgi:hypothetical protein